MSFTAKKLDWIERVVRDHTVQPSACRVATLIGLYYLNRTSGDAWPSQSKLAADLGVSRSTMQRALNELAGSGHMTRQISCGKTNHYRPILEAANVQDDAPIAEPTCFTGDAPTCFIW